MGVNDVPAEVIDLMAREFSLSLMEFLQVTDKVAEAQLKLMSVSVRACMGRAVEAAFPPEVPRRRRSSVNP